MVNCGVKTADYILGNYKMQSNTYQQPIIRAKRLYLSKMRVEDAPQVMKWCGDKQALKFLRFNVYNDVRDLEKWIADQLSNPAEFGVFLNDRTLIGSMSCFETSDGMYELGYVFNREYWGSGYATEAAYALLSYTAETKCARSFYIRHAVENMRSQRVIEKLGFVFLREGFYSKFDGSVTFRDRQYTLTVNLQRLNLDTAPYNKIACGQKTVELRLNDEKRRNFSVGDFVALSCGENTIVAKITDIRRYKNFAELYAAEDMTKCGYDNAQTASWEDMTAYYPIEKQKKYGALAIEIQVLALYANSSTVC